MKFMNTVEAPEKAQEAFPWSLYWHLRCSVWEHLSYWAFAAFVLLWIHTDWKEGGLPRDNLDQRKELGSSSEIQFKEGKTSKATENKTYFLGLLQWKYTQGASIWRLLCHYFTISPLHTGLFLFPLLPCS